MKLIKHRYEVNGVDCECGVKLSDSFHSCEKKLPICVIDCSNDCDKCVSIESQQAYKDARWRKNLDGYICCGECGEKLGAGEDICSFCFCVECEGRNNGYECEDCGRSCL